MTNEIEAETHVQSTPAATLKDQKQPDSKTVGNNIPITAFPLLSGKQQSIGTNYLTDVHGSLHQLAPKLDSHNHDHEKHKHGHEHKKVPEHPDAFKGYGDKMVGHTANTAAPTHQLNRM